MRGYGFPHAEAMTIMDVMVTDEPLAQDLRARCLIVRAI